MLQLVGTIAQLVEVIRVVYEDTTPYILYKLWQPVVNTDKHGHGVNHFGTIARWGISLHILSFWYGTDNRREKFVAMCRDPDVQTLTWQSYTTKKLVRRRPFAHIRVFFKDVAQLLGLARA